MSNVISDKAAAVAIVGCGPAGTATALELIRRGMPGDRIMLLDRQAFPRQKLCGGGITGRGWERLQRWGIELQYICDAQGIGLVCNGRGQVLHEPTRLGTVDRYELDNAMLERALALGAVFRRASVAEVIRRSDGWILRLSDGEPGDDSDHQPTNKIEARYLIGADGYSSQVRRALGLPMVRGGKLLEVTLPVADGADTDKESELPVLEMEFSPVLEGVEGYMWTFLYRDARSGGKAVKYGIMDRSGKTRTGTLKRLLDAYIVGQGQVPPTTCSGYPERYFRPFERVFGLREALVGDAWGVDPLLGEGLAVSFEQAEYVAGAIVRAWRKNSRISRWYNVFHPFSATGWNLWFLKKLGDFVYCGDSRFWLSILTQDGALSALSRTARFGGYGRFARHWWLLTVVVVRQFWLQKILRRLPERDDE